MFPTVPVLSNGKIQSTIIIWLSVIGSLPARSLFFHTNTTAAILNHYIILCANTDVWDLNMNWPTVKYCTAVAWQIVL